MLDEVIFAHKFVTVLMITWTSPLFHLCCQVLCSPWLCTEPDMALGRTCMCSVCLLIVAELP